LDVVAKVIFPLNFALDRLRALNPVKFLLWIISTLFTFC